jgi:hypothetical protein
MKKQFNIEVIRTGFGFKTIMVKAENLREAEDKALDEAGDHEYSEKSSEYGIVNASTPVKKITLEDLKEEYKKSIEENKMDSRDYESYIQEINDANTLAEFVEVVGLWAISLRNETPEQIILRRILDIK